MKKYVKKFYYQNVKPNMDKVISNPLTFLLTGNIPGAMLGGLMLGLFNAMITGYISSQWAETFTFVLLIVILVFRPTGILGEKVAEKV